MNNELDKIKDILERVLEEKYPSFPKDVVFSILQIQKENSNNQVEAQKKISAYLTKYFKENPNVAF